MGIEECFLAFDGSSTYRGGGAGVVLYAPNGTNISLCSNTETDYETLVIGLIFAVKMTVRRLWLHGNSKLIIKQVIGEFGLKEVAFVPYELPSRSWSNPSPIQFEHMLQEHNRQADALATPASKIDVPGQAIDVSIPRKTLSTTAQNWSLPLLLLNKIGVAPIIQNLVPPLQLCFRGTWGTSLSLVASSTNFHVEIMVSAFIGDCKGKDITGPRWSRRLSSCNQLVRSARNHSFKEQEIGTDLYGFPFSTEYCHPIVLMQWRSKGNPVRFFVEEAFLF